MDEYVKQTKARKPVPIESLPEIKPFSPMVYQRSDQRSPFIAPQPETSSRLDAKAKPDCAQIVANREKEVLERYSLASLSMKGSIGKQGQLWALIKTRTGKPCASGSTSTWGWIRAGSSR